VSVAASVSGRLGYDPFAGEPQSHALTVFAAGIGVVALAGRPSGAVLDRVWAALTSGSTTIEALVEAIPLVGEDAVASFAVVVIEGAPGRRDAETASRDVTAVVRGEASIALHSESGKRLFAGEGVLPWHLAGFARVRAIEFGRARQEGATLGSLSSGAFPLHAGGAVVSRALWSLASAEEGWPFSVLPADTDAELSDAIPARLDVDGETTLQSPRRVPSPRFRVRIGETTPFLLDDAVLVGRNPRAPIPIGVRPPMLVTVSSPSREVSSTHVEIMQRGEQVVVTDLKSTNGTTVALPGAARIKLRQGESIVTPPRSRIEIGDGNIIEILPED
jgi:hypothetical protein